MKANCILLFLILLMSCNKPTATQPESTEKNAAPASIDTVEPPADTADMPMQAVDTIGLSGQRVYVTNEGDKYHTGDCRYAKGAQAVSLEKAKASGKTACGICKPNSKTGDKQTRCSAKTKEGKQCDRMTSNASGKCYQHQSN
jgi:hypothetical protein